MPWRGQSLGVTVLLPEPFTPILVPTGEDDLSSTSSSHSLHTVDPTVHLSELSFVSGAPGSPEAGGQPLPDRAYSGEVAIL